MAPCGAVLATIFIVLFETIRAEDRPLHVTHFQLSSDATPAAKGLCGCEPVPEDQCTCDLSLQYLKCVEKRCGSGDCSCPASPFLGECNAVSGACGAELRLSGCDQSLTTCAGRFHQASHGVVGFTLDDSHLDDEAYCGPFGRCTGELRIIASARRQPPGAFLECVLPAVAGQVHRKAELVHCARELSEHGVAECSLPMMAQLEPSQEANGHCYLTDGDGGAKITKDAWFVVRNRYKEDSSAVATPKKTMRHETKKRLKSSGRKARQARKAEEDIGAAEVSKEASAQSMKKGKRTRATWDSNMVIVLLVVIAAIGAALIYLKSKKVTS